MTKCFRYIRAFAELSLAIAVTLFMWVKEQFDHKMMW